MVRVKFFDASSRFPSEHIDVLGIKDFLGQAFS